MTEPRVLTEIDGPVAHVWLNRPDKLNGVDLGLLEGLLDAAAVIRRNRDVRVVVLQGKGDSFCAGLDFAEVGRSSKLSLARFFVPNPLRGTNLFQQSLWAWRELPVPVIAVTRGHVFGAGIQLALAADFRFTTPDAQWSILEAKWGLVPDMSGTVPLSELTTADVAKRLTMTGEVFSGEQAVAYGIASGSAEDPMKPGPRARRRPAGPVARLGLRVEEAAQPVASRRPARRLRAGAPLPVPDAPLGQCQDRPCGRHEAHRAGVQAPYLWVNRSELCEQSVNSG
jgi:enoyl-CoA hydratase/carnithine racemase